MGAEVSVPIWLLAMLGAGFTALVFAAWLFGRGDLRGALDMARDWETKATFGAIKEETGRACRRAILALSVERAAFSAVPLAAAHSAARSRPYLTPEPGPHVLVKPLVPVTYINPSSDAAAWAVDVKPGAVILDEPPVPNEEHPFPLGEDDYPHAEESKTGRHRAPDWLLEDDTRQILSAAGARELREAGR